MLSLIGLADVLEQELKHCFLRFLAVVWTVQRMHCQLSLAFETPHFTFALTPLLLRCSINCLKPEEILPGKEHKRLVPKSGTKGPIAFLGEANFLTRLPSECLGMSVDWNTRLLFIPVGKKDAG